MKNTRNLEFSQLLQNDEIHVRNKKQCQNNKIKNYNLKAVHIEANTITINDNNESLFRIANYPARIPVIVIHLVTNLQSLKWYNFILLKNHESVEIFAKYHLLEALYFGSVPKISARLSVFWNVLIPVKGVTQLSVTTNIEVQGRISWLLKRLNLTPNGTSFRGIHFWLGRTLKGLSEIRMLLQRS